MGMDLHVDFHWGIMVDKDVIDELTGTVERETQGVAFDSSTLKRAFYDEYHSTLLLEFNSEKHYQYKDVPLKVFQGLCKAKSAGNYFNRYIKDEYEFDEMIQGEKDKEPLFDSVEDIEAKEQIEITEYSNARAPESGDCDGYIIGFSEGSYMGFGPQEFDPNDYKVSKVQHKKLRQFRDKYSIPWEELQWWIYIYSSI